MEWGSIHRFPASPKNALPKPIPDQYRSIEIEFSLRLVMLLKCFVGVLLCVRSCAGSV
jgi:hypothetical protein